MNLKVNAPKYFVEVSTDTTVSKATFHRWARNMVIDEEGEERGVGRWYNFPFSSIKEARKFRTRVLKEVAGTSVRIFKTHFIIHEEHKVVE